MAGIASEVVELLRKRRAELTQRDADVMEQVVDFVLTLGRRDPRTPRVTRIGAGQ
jgi:hypothetical protein